MDFFKTSMPSQQQVVSRWGGGGGGTKAAHSPPIAYDVRNIAFKGTAGWKILFIGSGWMVWSQSNHSAFIRYHCLQHYLGISWIYMEGDWGQLSHGPTYPLHPLNRPPPKKKQNAVVEIILKPCDTAIMTRQAAIMSLIKVRISTDLSSICILNCSYDPWSFDEMFARWINQL